METTRVFWARSRARGVDEDTIIPAKPDRGSGGISHREALFRSFDAVREWVVGMKGEGLAVVALDAAGLQAKGYLKTGGGVDSLVLGRHDQADLCLPDPTVSLRHLAAIVHSEDGSRGARVRLIDLRTPRGFRDVHGNLVRGLSLSSPALVGCGRYSLLVVPTAPSGLSWPDTPELAWHLLANAGGEGATAPPVTIDDVLVAERDETLGELVVTSESSQGVIPVGRRAARAGILLGRSERCDSGTLLTDPHISRVHVLIVELGGRLYAIDTASKNGLWEDAADAHARALVAGQPLSLAGHASVEWRYFH